jgi:nucleotide-binding universal stress UspA family protein
LGECVLPHAETIAAACPKVVIEMVRVVEPVNLPTRGGIALSEDDIKQINANARKEAEDYLSKIKQKLVNEGINVKTTLLTGKAGDVIGDYIKKTDADLVILSTHGRSGPSQWLWGSVAEKILHSVCIPITMVRSPGCFPGK